MKEFMLFIYANGNPIEKLSFKNQQKHVQRVGEFIHELDRKGILKVAQPLKREGISLSTIHGNRIEENLQSEGNTIVGYYHIEVSDIESAVEIARSDPRFLDSDWTIVVRPVMTMEGITL